MPRKTTRTTRARKTTRKPSRDFAQEIADGIAAKVQSALDSGERLPWHKPWSRPKMQRTGKRVVIMPASGPYNVVSRRPYNGINVWLLGGQERFAGNGPSCWGTFKQWKEIAAKHCAAHGYTESDSGDDENPRPRSSVLHNDAPDARFGASVLPGVRKGEKGSQVILWKPFEAQKRGEDGKVERDGSGNPVTERRLMMRTFTVFHWSQIEGIDPAMLPDGMRRKVSFLRPALPTVHEIPAALRESHPAAAVIADAIFAAMPGLILVCKGSDSAHYAPGIDTINMPRPEQFACADDWWAVLFHECIHASGAAHRLNREYGTRFGNHAYAAEELVADLGSAIVSAIAGVDSSARRHDHTRYLAHWVKLCADQKNAIHTANKGAREAVTLLLGEQATASGVFDTAEEAQGAAA